jgi:hypothetical protein
VRAGDDAARVERRLKDVVAADAGDAAADEDDLGQRVSRAQLADAVEQDGVGRRVRLARRRRAARPREARRFEKRGRLREPFGVARRDEEARALRPARLVETPERREQDALLGRVRAGGDDERASAVEAEPAPQFFGQRVRARGRDVELDVAGDPDPFGREAERGEALVDEAADVAGDFEGAVERVRALLDAAELTQALEEIWKLVRRLNQYVQDEAPWQLAKEDGAAERLDAVLYGLAEGLRVVSVLLHPFMPESVERLLGALRDEDRSLGRARLGAARGGGRVGELSPLFPRVTPAGAGAAAA